MSKIRIPRFVSILFAASLLLFILDLGGILGSSYLSEITWEQVVFLSVFLMLFSWLGWYQEHTPGSSVVAHGIYVGTFAVIYGVMLRIATGLQVQEISADYGQYIGEFVFFGVFEPWYMLLLILWVPGLLIGGFIEATESNTWTVILPVLTGAFPYIPVTWVVGSVVEISTMDIWIWETIYIQGRGMMIPVLLGVVGMYGAVLSVESMRQETIPQAESDYEPMLDERLTRDQR